MHGCDVELSGVCQEDCDFHTIRVHEIHVHAIHVHVLYALGLQVLYS